MENRISIHSPLAGRDRNTDRGDVRVRNISIHSPLAGRDRRYQARLYAV